MSDVEWMTCTPQTFNSTLVDRNGDDYGQVYTRVCVDPLATAKFNEQRPEIDIPNNFKGPTLGLNASAFGGLDSGVGYQLGAAVGYNLLSDRHPSRDRETRIGVSLAGAYRDAYGRHSPDLSSAGGRFDIAFKTRYSLFSSGGSSGFEVALYGGLERYNLQAQTDVGAFRAGGSIAATLGFTDHLGVRAEWSSLVPYAIDSYDRPVADPAVLRGSLGLHAHFGPLDTNLMFTVGHAYDTATRAALLDKTGPLVNFSALRLEARLPLNKSLRFSADASWTTSFNNPQHLADRQGAGFNLQPGGFTATLGVSFDLPLGEQRRVNVLKDVIDIYTPPPLIPKEPERRIEPAHGQV